MCETVRIGATLIKDLLLGKKLTGSRNLYPPEHQWTFKAEKVALQIDKSPKEKDKFRLLVDNLDVYDWFRAKKQEFLKSIGINIK